MSLAGTPGTAVSITDSAASGATIQVNIENTPMETNDTTTEVRLQEQRETLLVPKKPLTKEEEAKARRIHHKLHHLYPDKFAADPHRPRRCLSRFHRDKCHHCTKIFDDIVRQVHEDLLSGRLVMVGVTRTESETCNKSVQTGQSIGHCEGCQCHLREAKRDFSSETMSRNQCHCKRCMEEGNVVQLRCGNLSSDTLPSRPAPYRTRRAHTPCEDAALKDLHNHVLAGDKSLPGKKFVKILGSLHGQGPCRKQCKLKADVTWMRKRVPKQAGTQTSLAKDVCVQTAAPRALKHEATQANLHRSVGIQKGACLARMKAAKASWHCNSAIQVCMPELAHSHRPVGKVVGVQSAT